MRNNKLDKVIDEYRTYLEQHYGERLVKVILPGSQARGDATPDSNIDLLIVLKYPMNAGVEIDQTGDFTATLCLKYDVVVSPAFVSLSRFQQEASPFFRNVNREGVLV